MIHRLTERRAFEKARQRLVYLAWRKYGIAAEDAEDIVQNAVTTYCEVRSRYAEEENQYAILTGIFYKKCLEFIDRSTRDQRQFQSYCHMADAQRECRYLTPEDRRRNGSVLAELVQQEDGQLILSALAEIRPQARELFRLMIEEEFERREMIRHFGVNKNTYDTRLRAARKELRELLSSKGVGD
jgi:RNA polymerase sigma factor (sigma-70 family)